MARPRKNVVGDELEQQIQKAQEKVIKAKAAYEQAVDTLQVLLDKRDAQRKDELWTAVIRSSKSYEEILRLINNTEESEEE